VRFDVATDVTRFTGADERGALSENTVSEILWQLAPAGNGVDQVEPRYLRTTAPDRGAAGVDLVDFLHGWLAVGGARAPLRTALASRGFPYDCGGPVGCP